MDQTISQVKEGIKKLVQSFQDEGKSFEEVRLESMFDTIDIGAYVLLLKADWLNDKSSWEVINLFYDRLYDLRDQGLISNDTLKAIHSIRILCDETQPAELILPIDVLA